MDQTICLRADSHPLHAVTVGGGASCDGGKNIAADADVYKRQLVATVLANSIHYNNLDVIETGYGISLRPLSIFANEVYKDCDTHRFAVKRCV